MLSIGGEDELNIKLTANATRLEKKKEIWKILLLFNSFLPSFSLLFFLSDSFFDNKAREGNF